ncbi:hypothetical protein EDB92DRAFT_1816516 [Lactarius akahatsu]|uniref:Uncharacterized protein n=1 Tax=Lactarius akahatsu TaxID=416441 RepID=A0AAD4QAK7_9AGAM|nr:hypothetical protein EDB92DRAFT_1816516 [Lactarius akahatsu]
MEYESPSPQGAPRYQTGRSILQKPYRHTRDRRVARSNTAYPFLPYCRPHAPGPRQHNHESHVLQISLLSSVERSGQRRWRPENSACLEHLVDTFSRSGQPSTRSSLTQAYSLFALFQILPSGGLDDPLIRHHPHEHHRGIRPVRKAGVWEAGSANQEKGYSASRLNQGRADTPVLSPHSIKPQAISKYIEKMGPEPPTKYDTPCGARFCANWGRYQFRQQGSIKTDAVTSFAEGPFDVFANCALPLIQRGFSVVFGDVEGWANALTAERKCFLLSIATSSIAESAIKYRATRRLQVRSLDLALGPALRVRQLVELDAIATALFDPSIFDLTNFKSDATLIHQCRSSSSSGRS